MTDENLTVRSTGYVGVQTTVVCYCTSSTDPPPHLRVLVCTRYIYGNAAAERDLLPGEHLLVDSTLGDSHSHAKYPRCCSPFGKNEIIFSSCVKTHRVVLNGRFVPDIVLLTQVAHG